MYKVPLTKIKEVKPHSNAERLDIVKCYDFEIIVKKGTMKVDDEVVFVPVDSVLPTELEKYLFPEGSKIKLDKGRIKQTRIRSVPSQGFVITKEEIEKFLDKSVRWEQEKDYSDILKIVKYEPPEPDYAPKTQNKKGRKVSKSPYFHQYNGIDNIKWWPNLFNENEEVIVQCKLHGGNMRVANLPYIADTWWKKLLQFLHLSPKRDFRYGSNKVDITGSFNYKGYYGEDIYGQLVKKLDLFSKVNEDEILYGEIIGNGVQKGYDYGHKNEHHFVLFAIKKWDFLSDVPTWKWLNPEEVEQIAKERGLTFVPVLYRGPYNKELIEKFVSGPSVYDPNTKVREGIVIKSRYNITNKNVPSSKKEVKWINPDYLDNGRNTDFH